MNTLQEYNQKQMKPADKVDGFNVGDTVRVHFRIVEGEKERVQVFEGVVIARKSSTGPLANFTVRRVAHGEGCERVFPLHSPRVERVEVIREGAVRRAKLHYLRERSGKSARIKAKGRGAAATEQPAEPKKKAGSRKKAKAAAETAAVADASAPSAETDTAATEE